MPSSKLRSRRPAAAEDARAVERQVDRTEARPHVQRNGGVTPLLGIVAVDLRRSAGSAPRPPFGRAGCNASAVTVRLGQPGAMRPTWTANGSDRAPSCSTITLVWPGSASCGTWNLISVGRPNGTLPAAVEIVPSKTTFLTILFLLSAT